MSSILTNTSALTALQTLKLTNQSLEESSARVATGQKVATAKDDAAYWSIATTLRSDNGVVSAVKQGLGIGASTVNIAAAGLSDILTRLSDLKSKLTEALTPGVSRADIQGKIDTTLNGLKQVATGAAQGGEAWLSVDSTSGQGYQNVRKIVSSFTRVQGTIAVDAIEVNLDDIKVYDKNTTAGTTGTDASATGGTTYRTAEATFKAAAEVYAHVDHTDAATTTYTNASTAFIQAKKDYEADLKTKNGAAKAGADGTGGILNKEYAVFGADENGYYKSYQLSVSSIQISNVQDTDLSKVRAYINVVEAAEKAVKSAAGTLGSVQSQISSQQNFIDTLTKANTTSIGVLVDADMEEESTRLKALQVQQQLGVQSLTIANQSTQQILSLFRS